jgi:hypothetical protein
LLAYTRYGAEHAATGWDHVLFVLLLIAVATRFRQAALLVTGFTLGHATTLLLAALSVLESDARAVEVLIAASIVLVAAENLAELGRPDASSAQRASPIALVALGSLVAGAALEQPALVFFALFAGFAGGMHALTHDASTRLRLAFASAFGLVHGLGFASGFDAQGPLRLPRLLAFNVGVELAQVALVALAWPLLRALGPEPQTPRRAQAVALLSVTAATLAAYACVARALGAP